MYGDGVLLFELYVRSGKSFGNGTGGVLGAIAFTGVEVVLQILEEILVGGLRVGRSIGLDGGDGFLRGEGIGSDDADEIAVAHHFDAGEFFGGAGVEGGEGRVEAFGTQHCAEHASPGERCRRDTDAFR